MSAEVLPPTLPRDYRDLVIEMQADREVELIERVVVLEADVRVYRLIANAALTAFWTLGVRHDRIVENNRRLRDELRALREDLLLRAGADDEAAA